MNRGARPGYNENMSESGQRSGNGKATGKEARAARLAEALRANLKRRKEAARLREEKDKAGSPDTDFSPG